MNNAVRQDVDLWKRYWKEVGDKYKDPWQTYGMSRINVLEQRFIKDSIDTLNNEEINLLDIGVGNGRILEILLDQVLTDKNKKVYGIDYADEMVDYCKQKFEGNSNLRGLRVANIIDEDIPFSEMWDGVTIIRVLKYLSSWQGALKKISRSVKDNGVIVFTLPNKISINRFAGLPGNIKRASTKEIKGFINSDECKDLELEEIRGFSILPDALYMINNKIIARYVYLLDRILVNIFGNNFNRVLFYRVRVKR